MLLLVDHRGNNIQHSFTRPCTPVLKYSIMSFGFIPSSARGRTRPKANQCSRNFNGWLNRGRIKVNTPHDVCDLLAPPIVPFWIVSFRIADIGGSNIARRGGCIHVCADVAGCVIGSLISVTSFETLDACFVVADVDAERLTDGAINRRFRVTNAVEMQSVEVIL